MLLRNEILTFCGSSSLYARTDTPDEAYSKALTLSEMIEEGDVTELEFSQYCDSIKVPVRQDNEDLNHLAAQAFLDSHLGQAVLTLVLPSNNTASEVYQDLVRFSLKHKLRLQSLSPSFRGDIDLKNSGELPPGWNEWVGPRKISRSAIEHAYDNDQAATVVHLAPLWLEDHPNDFAVICWYADMLYQMTRYDESIDLITNTIQQTDDNARHYHLHMKMGDLERYRGDYSESERWYKKAVDLDSDDASAFVFLGAVQARQRKLKEAEQTHRNGTRCKNGVISEAYHNLGLVLRGQGRLRESAINFKEALKINPDYENAFEALRDIERTLDFIAQKDE
ncbi:MAG: hypothetical protein COA78_18810 [Blastopirellula sp.]|nr:MAG: hypothetical protein COA78_18810 [Blastopirellula sp.]